MAQVSLPENPENLMWKPENVQDHNLTKFRNWINEKFGEKLENYQELHKWSCQNYDQFWGEIWTFCKVVFSQDYDKVVNTQVPIQEVPKWFPGAKLNYAENLLK